MLRIAFSNQTVKKLQTALQQAYEYTNRRLLRRVSVLLDLGAGLSVVEIAAKWQISGSCIYHWLQLFRLEGMASLQYKRPSGRKPKLSLTQKKELCEVLEQGPQSCGYMQSCWNSVLVQKLILTRFGVEYARHYVVALLKSLGYSYQKAEFVAAKRDEVARQKWSEETWPALLQEAVANHAYIVFEDKASFAWWGSLSYSWAKRGQTPQVLTSGQRRGLKVFGAIEYFSGKLWYDTTEAKFNGESYQAFLEQILKESEQPIYLIQGGARYHTSQAMKEYFAENTTRLKVYQLPSYSPDFNPIEYVWRKTKRRATHNHYFAEFKELETAVTTTLQYWESQPAEIVSVYGCYDNPLSVQAKVAA